MNVKSNWVKLFAAGTALVILSSAATAVAMTSLFQDRASLAARSAVTSASNGQMQNGTLLAGNGNAAGDTVSLTGPAPSATAGSLPSPTEPAAATSPLTQPELPASTSTTAPAGTQATSAPSPTKTPAATTARSTATATTRADTAGGASATTATTGTGAVSTARFITSAQASAIALQRIGTSGLRLVAWELDSDEYPPVYEIKLADSQYRYEVKVHAVTGLVIETERDPL